MRPKRIFSVLGLFLLTLLAGCGKGPSTPSCGNGSVLILMAQAVPSAEFVPCITEFPEGWTFGGQEIETGEAMFWLDSDRGGSRAVTVTLTETCNVSGAIRVPTEEDEAGMRRFEEPLALPPNFSGNRYYLFPGGCISYGFSFLRSGSFDLAVEASDALTFFSRQEGLERLRREGLPLPCGAGVSCPG